MTGHQRVYFQYKVEMEAQANEQYVELWAYQYRGGQWIYPNPCNLSVMKDCEKRFFKWGDFVKRRCHRIKAYYYVDEKLWQTDRTPFWWNIEHDAPDSSIRI
jgi:hypothetical protein